VIEHMFVLWPTVAPRAEPDPVTPLWDTTFCALDLETTGGSASTDRITEIGAIKMRRGETLGTFHTLVDPGRPVPAFVRLLTGIDDAMLLDAPPIEAVLPSLLEFTRGTVVVAHNARFDVSFLDAALQRASYEPLGLRVVDTARLARKVLAGEVANHRLETLARHFRCAHRPCHRAFADALAASDVLHHLIERVAGFGVTTLEDLLATSAARLDGSFAKIALTDGLPRSAGVYRFLGASGETLYVGVATDLRARVRSYFYGDGRRGIRNLLRETQSIVAERHACGLEAAVAEARAISRESPPYNRAGKGRVRWYVKFSSTSSAARVGTCRSPHPRTGVYVGPLASSRDARALIDALRDGFSLHRCPEPARCHGCAFRQLGVCAGPGPAQRAEVRAAASALLCDPSSLLTTLRRRLERLSRQQRFEEAEDLRRRALALERAVARGAEIQALLDAGEVVMAVDGRLLLVRDAQLAAACDRGADDDGAAIAALRRAARHVPVDRFVPDGVGREAGIIAAWLRRHPERVELVSVSGAWAHPAAIRPGASFASPPGRTRRRARAAG
jgi:DNA polymerase-3 subunit epsilon